ncbi:MAG: hypothetical protein AAF728_01730 [Cyanobacteria bacterium P01_D01_bin.128]
MSQSPFPFSGANPLESGLHLALGAAHNLQTLFQDPAEFNQQLEQLRSDPQQLFSDLTAEGSAIAQEIHQDIRSRFNFSRWGSGRASLPDYISNPTDQTFAQPYTLKGTNLYGYVLEGALPKLQQLCDQFLNAPAQGNVHYQAAIPYVLLTFDSIEHISSTDLPDRNRGFVGEEEAAVWILTLVGKKIGPIFRVERLAWFIPYIFVDNSPVMASGREVYGIPKALAGFQLPDLEDLQKPATLHTLTWKTLTAQTEAKWEKLLTVKATDPVKVTPWQTLREASQALIQVLINDPRTFEIPGWQLPFNVADYLLNFEVPAVALKQFRDGVDGTKACYQGILEFPFDLTRFHAGGILGTESLGTPFTVEIGKFASHPLVETLGLTVQDGNVRGEVDRVPVEFAFWVSFDFALTNAKIIWENR